MITFIPKSNYNLCTITFFEVKQFQNIHILKFFNIKRTAYKKSGHTSNHRRKALYDSFTFMLIHKVFFVLLFSIKCVLGLCYV